MSEITLLDGSIGQELVKRSGEKPTPLWSTMVMLDDTKLLSEVHDEYFSMGATVATTNTYPVLKDRLERVGLEGRLEELWDRAIETAISSKNKNGYGQVAGSIGPLHASYRPDLIPDAIEASKQYKDVINHLSAKCDILLIETLSSIEHAKAALIAAKDVKIPVWIAFSTEDYDGTKLRSGEDLSLAKNLLNQYTFDAVLINCSRPEVGKDSLKILADFNKPFGAYANGFTKITTGFLKDFPTVDALKERHDLSPKEYAKFAMEWVEMGATIIGGCCEVGPRHIEQLAKDLRENGHKIV